MSPASAQSGNRLQASELIRLTGQRARVVQRVVSDRVEADEAEGIWPAAGREAVPPDGIGHEATTSDGEPGAIRVATFDSLYPRVGDGELPPATLTNTNLHHYLAAAMETQPGFADIDDERRGWRAWVGRRLASPHQARFNAAVLHVLHQLDHRSQVQEHRIVALEARLAAAERRPGSPAGQAVVAADEWGSGR